MKIGVFTICHNEKHFLPYFFRHYRSFANYISILDNNSTDGSFEICLRESDNVEAIDTENLHKIEVMTALKNNYWKNLKNFDWIFIVDVDEIVYHPDIIQFLEKSKKQGYTVLVPTAYQMICEDFPTGNGQITDLKSFGVLSTTDVTMKLLSCPIFGKKCVISPKDIEETNYGVGGHHANMVGKINELCDPNLKLLHYRCLGIDYLINKNKMRASRLTPDALNRGSWHYLKSEDELTNMFKEFLMEAKNVVRQ